MEVAEPALLSAPPRRRTPGLRRGSEEQVRVKRQTLQTVLEQCQSALELLKTAGQDPDPALEAEDAEEDKAATNAGEPCDNDRQTDELCELIKSKLDSPDFLDKFGSIHMSVCHDISDNSASWDVVSAADLWENEHVDGDNDSDQEDYVLVSQEDIVEGIASYMAAYLLSLKQTKVLSPNQLQEALSKTFSVKKKKSKLRKAWDGSKVIYNVASWGATAIGVGARSNDALLEGGHSAAISRRVVVEWDFNTCNPVMQQQFSGTGRPLGYWAWPKKHRVQFRFLGPMGF